ncbi:P-loop NTPase fold protein [Thalassoglobus sp.]|uniref:P-loop NTPase fold protein n=1 Tax=Thalassoglobus sp. TaxID=2795869 RepID=UPI003AA7D0E4
MIKIIDDAPSSIDEFSGGDDTGPHKRIAAAIERRIHSPEGGGMIGLHGDYGSGKSTIVDILKKSLSSQPEVCFVLFNAWSHEGDPLRRSFLEALIDSCLEKKWINKSHWCEVKNKLSKRTQSKDEEKTSSPTKLATFLAIATVLVPVGILLGTKGLKTATLELDSSLPISWTTVIGLFFVLGPVWVLIANFLQLLIRRILYLVSRFYFKKLEIFSIEKIFEVRHWSFLSQHGTTTIKSDITATLDPTSIEFERDFGRLLDEALDDVECKLVLVIDNLDRLNATQSLAIWSNLQTFINCNTCKNQRISSAFSVIVPYTPAALTELWESANAVTDAESVYEKTFRIRYATPPPTLSDWRAFLESKLRDAIPDLQSEEISALLELVHLSRRERGKRLVPRQLKLFVNQLAILYELWNRTLPTTHLAYSILHSESRADFENCLTSRKTTESTKFPSDEAIQICGDGLVESLAAIHFNVPIQHAMQLLIEEPIEDALASGNGELIQELSDLHGSAFWSILLSVIRRLIKSVDQKVLSTWSMSLKLLENQNLPVEANRVREYVRGRIKELDGPWLPLDDDAIVGLCEWANLDKSPKMRRLVAKTATRTLKSTTQDLALAPRLKLAKHLSVANLLSYDQDQKLVPLQLHMRPESWLDEAAKNCRLEDGQIFIEPACTLKSIVSEMCKRVESEEYSEFCLGQSDVDALAKLKELGKNVDTSELIEQLKSTLTSNANATDPASIAIVAYSVRRLHELRLIGEDSADVVLRSEGVLSALVKSISPASKISDSESTIIASICFADIEAIEKYSPSEEVKAKMTSLRSSGDVEETERIWQEIVAFKCQGVVGDLAGKNSSGLLMDLIEHAMSDGNVAWVLPDWFVKRNADWLLRSLNDRDASVEEVVRQLEDDEDSIRHLENEASISESQHRSAIQLFFDHGSEKLKSRMNDFVVAKSRHVDSEKWKDDLQTNCELLQFINQFHPSDDNPIVAATFKNAFIETIPMILNGDVKLTEDAVEAVSTLVSKIPNEQTLDLGIQALNTLRTGEKGVNDTIVRIAGEAMLKCGIEFDANVVAAIIARSMHGGGEPSISWCVEWGESRPINLDELSEEKETFLRDEIDAALLQEGKCDETRGGIERLRELFDLQVEEIESGLESQENEGESDSSACDDNDSE